ncbi:hypothetical protein CVIRNUC_007806 [Coccomyxa viridis]|uniref:Glucosidase II beta subunit N-terminal domain-containing protein n=1 Tax=Coccomyxa viridis TaxID=1274662 RepID=A0AAV1IEI3_9CHLO|nr:hypothetical protein CVIRNUC_007806 [Coccomyxa viridis]
MAIRQALHAVPVILLTVLGNAHCASLNIRGLDPSLAEYYKQSGDSFKCLDGQRTIKYGLINDNYCDCFDGSDEPGTSACVHGKFYCRNRGYTPQLLNASMIDDGFCDCCDGSDESSGKCSNTCAQAGAAARAALKAKAATEAAGAKVKEGYVRQAQDDKQKWQAEEQKLNQQVLQQKKLVEEWRVKKDRVEASEAEEKQRQETERKLQEEAQRKADEERAAQLGKPDAEEVAPGEPAGDHITAAEPANAQGMRLHISESTLRLAE